MIYLALIAVLLYYSSTDLIVLDGVSAPIPILRMFNMKVLFYCHFPDLVRVHIAASQLFTSLKLTVYSLQLLCYDRSNWLKRCYRYVLDGLEEWTTGCADLVLVNSSKLQ